MAGFYLSRSSTTTFPCPVVWRTELARPSQARSSFYKQKQKRLLDSSLSLFSFAFCSLHRYALFTMNRGKETYRSSGATLFSLSPTATDPFFKKKKMLPGGTDWLPLTPHGTEWHSSLGPRPIIFFNATSWHRATLLSRSATDHISFLNVTVRHRATLLRSYFFTPPRGTERHRSLGTWRMYFFKCHCVVQRRCSLTVDQSFISSFLSYNHHLRGKEIASWSSEEKSQHHVVHWTKLPNSSLKPGSSFEKELHVNLRDKATQNACHSGLPLRLQNSLRCRRS